MEKNLAGNEMQEDLEEAEYLDIPEEDIYFLV